MTDAHRPRRLAAAFTCTANTLTLHRPVGAMVLADQTLLRRWLTTHGLEPDLITVGRPVRRDTGRRLVQWTGSEGGSEVVHMRHVPVKDDDRLWPAPFPEALISPTAFTDADGYELDPG